MKEETGDLIHGFEGDAVCITTNGEVKKDKEAVMGVGIALQATFKWKSIARVLGDRIKEDGNHVHRLTFEEGGLICLPETERHPQETVAHHIFSLPVKRKWSELADLALIRRSLAELVTLTEGMKRVGVPWPGIGAGGLTKDVVEPIVRSMLEGERFVLVEYEPSPKRFQKLTMIDGGTK